MSLMSITWIVLCFLAVQKQPWKKRKVNLFVPSTEEPSFANWFHVISDMTACYLTSSIGSNATIQNEMIWKTKVCCIYHHVVFDNARWGSKLRNLPFCASW
jgi:hypothetical protein